MPFPNPLDLRFQRPSAPEGPGPSSQSTAGPKEARQLEGTGRPESSEKTARSWQEGVAEAFLSRYESKATRRSYRQDLRRFFGEDPVHLEALEESTRREVMTFLRGEVAAGLSRSTAERRFKTLSSFFQWAEEQGLTYQEDASLPTSGQSAAEAASSAMEEACLGERGSSDEGQTLSNAGLHDMKPPPWVYSAAVEGALGKRAGKPGAGVSKEASSEEKAYSLTRRLPLSQLPEALIQALSLAFGDGPRGEGALEEAPVAETTGAGEPWRIGGALWQIVASQEEGLSVTVAIRQGTPQVLALASHRHIRRLAATRLRNGGSSFLKSLEAFKAAQYLWKRGWDLPPILHDLWDVLPDKSSPGRDGKAILLNGELTGSLPRWTRPVASSVLSWREVAVEVTGAMAGGFGVGKEEEIRLEASPVEGAPGKSDTDSPAINSAKE